MPRGAPAGRADRSASSCFRKAWRSASISAAVMRGGGPTAPPPRPLPPFSTSPSSQPPSVCSVHVAAAAALCPVRGRERGRGGGRHAFGGGRGGGRHAFGEKGRRAVDGRGARKGGDGCNCPHATADGCRSGL
eukprot:344679-Chlamydomonas_euryale.AAC.2